MIVRRLPAFRGTLRPLLLTTTLATALALPFPHSAGADTDLTLGASAVVAYADGDDVRLRTDSSYDSAVIAMIPEGSTVEAIDGPFEANDGSLWYQVWANGSTGFIVSDYLASSSAIYSETSGTAVTNDSVNLRSGPGLGETILASLGSGERVTLTGDSSNGWLSVDYGSTAGYIYGAFLSAGGESSTAGASAGESLSVDPGTRYTDDSLNLRTGPSLDNGVLAVLPMGAPVELTGMSNGDFVEVTSSSGTGWVAAQFLLASAPSPSSPEESPENFLIEWPIRGGTWSVLQGYNGSSHQNRTDLWQYKYSLDLVYEDGETGGQPVYSPVSGTVRWYDESTGGVSIDMGNGYAFAMFHVIFDAGIPEGATVSQGDYLGYIAYPGDGANGGTPHLHIAVWETDDGGNWSRRAVPFVADLGLSGVTFPDNGASYDHTGATVNP
jgi:uncharacterized protein YgiM (DUF1202 family)